MRGEPPFPSPPFASPRTARQEVRLAGLRIAGARYRRRSPAGGPRNILLIRPDHLGDVLFLTPGLRALREALPRARITLMVGPWAADVVRGNPDVDAILTCPFPGFERRPKAGLFAPYRLLAETARRLRHEAFDAAVVLRCDHWWGAWLAAEAGIPARFGYAVPETQPFLTDALAYATDRHEVLQNTRLLAALAPTMPETPGPSRFVIPAGDQDWALRWLRERGVSATRPLIAIHPGAGAAVKQWPPARWATLAGELITTCGAQVVLTGSPAERELADAVQSSLEYPVINAAGETSLGRLAAVLEQCRLVLGSDSGPLHLAVAVGAPTVHLYGPVDAAKFGPWGPALRHIVVRTDWPCAPCNRLDWAAHDLPKHGCIPAIAEQAVRRAAGALLKEQEPAV